MRYFFVYYTWSGSNTAQNGDGNLRFESSSFPSNAILHEAAKRNCPCPASIVIANWREFDSKEDSLAFEVPLAEGPR